MTEPSSSILEATCKCGSKARVQIDVQSADRTIRVGCEDHWFELPEEGLKSALTKAESPGERNPR